METKSKRKIILFMVVYFFAYMAFSIGTTQFIPYLSQLGFDASQRGILLSSIALVTILVQMIVGYLSDKYRTVKKFFICTLMLFALFTFFFYRSEGKKFIYVFIMLAMSGGLFNLLIGVSDNWVLESESIVGKYYSLIRSLGSLGWAIGSAMIAVIIAQFDFVGLANAVAFLAIIILGVALLIGDAQKADNAHHEEVKLADVKFLLSNGKYRLLILILFLIFSLNVFNTYTVTDKLISLQASTSQLGLKWSIAAMVEMPMFFCGVYLFQRYKPITMLKLAGVAYIVQFLIFSFVQNVDVLVYANVFQFATYPLALMASKHLVNECCVMKMRSTAQLVAMSIYNGVPALLMPMLSGLIIQWFHVDVALFFAVILVTCSCLLMPFYQRHK